MPAHKKIRVLVVDDSLMSREVIVKGISADPDIEVVGTAGDAFEARDILLTTRPHVITCDVAMPRMSGIEFVRRLLPEYFVPVVMVSAVSRAVFEAMEAGAVDFVVKPGGYSPKATEAFLLDLVQKIKTAATVCKPLPPPAQSAVPVPDIRQGAGRAIVIGASTGGTEAVFSILRALPPTVPGIAVVQHIPPVFSRLYAQRLDSQVALAVKEAETGDWLDPGSVLIAPGGRHMKLNKVGKRYRVECVGGEKVNGHRPSVDTLFESAATAAGSQAIGILLTGMGGDGARGLLALRRKGCHTIAQDEASSVVYGMPREALLLGAVERQAALGDIPRILCGLLG